MPATDRNSRGAALASRFYEARQRASRAHRPGARDLPIVSGLNAQCQSVVPLENVWVEVQGILVGTERVFCYGNNVVLEVGQGEDATLVVLSTGQFIETGAESWLSNFFVCQTTPAKLDDLPKQFPPPRKLVENLLRREPTLQAFPWVEHYSRRPVFDDQFILRGPGWHPEVGILVHSVDIDSILPDNATTEGAVLDRLPTHLRQLLNDFCFTSDADVANAVAVLLTGLLVSHFVISGKPVVLLDGNQAGVGKTLLARVISVVLDGVDPQLIHYTPDDEELQKRIVSTLRGSQQSVLVFDNAKLKAGIAISSPTIEANSVAPEVSLRILGKSENYRRPNDVLWFITMNDTKASPDLVSRGLPIRFSYEGDPAQRNFDGRDPIDYACEHRQEILGELAGMVVRWNQAGRPPGHRRHRLARWAELVGGVLCANGLPEGLTNLDEAASQFNTELDELAALAEVVLASSAGPVVYTTLDHQERQ